MTKPTHTPGPWVVKFWPKAECYIEGRNDGNPVHVCGPALPDDARLIAAAPELLASLQELLELHIAHHNNPAHVSARAVIAKAKGEEE